MAFLGEQIGVKFFVGAFQTSLCLKGDAGAPLHDGMAHNQNDDNIGQALSALKIELVAEAKAAAASRLLIEQLQIARISLLLDLHASKATNHIPFSIDTNRYNTLVSKSPPYIVKFWYKEFCADNS